MVQPGSIGPLKTAGGFLYPLFPENVEAGIRTSNWDIMAAIRFNNGERKNMEQEMETGFL